MNCPCQSGESYELCCGRFISHQALAENAQQLMRSRYTAYALNEQDYLMQSWHPDYRPADLQQDDSIKWLRLDILGCLIEGDKAMVEFEAQLLLDGKVQGLHEKSQFVVDQGRWLYTSGEMIEPGFKSWKPGRNEECPCGSGFKFKRCCGQ
ncbi:MAG: zinc chelation protein SecC [Gammaproteobacteria bacterium]|nr:zinc chelation protein SecC [Gammaproteobacteria bacterium]